MTNCPITRRRCQMAKQKPPFLSVERRINAQSAFAFALVSRTMEQQHDLTSRSACRYRRSSESSLPDTKSKSRNFFVKEDRLHLVSLGSFSPGTVTCVNFCFG